MKTETKKTNAPTDPKIAEAVKLMTEAQKLLDRIVHLVEPAATSALPPVGSIGISIFDPKDERTREFHRLSGRIGELRATFYGRRDQKIYGGR